MVIAIDFSIFHAGGSYGHANGLIETAAGVEPGTSIDLSHLVPLPLPEFFSGLVRVESVVAVEGADDVYACADVCVRSKDEARLLGLWLELVPGLSVWPNDLDHPLLADDGAEI